MSYNNNPFAKIFSQHQIAQAQEDEVHRKLAQLAGDFGCKVKLLSDMHNHDTLWGVYVSNKSGTVDVQAQHKSLRIVLTIAIAQVEEQIRILNGGQP